MIQSVQRVLDLTQANLRLCFGIADAWQKNCCKLMEIGRRGTSEVAEEARLALTLSVADGTRSPAADSIDGHLHDFVAELEALRMATEMQIGDAVGEWRERSIAALGIEPGHPLPWPIWSFADPAPPSQASAASPS